MRKRLTTEKQRKDVRENKALLALFSTRLTKVEDDLKAQKVKL
jgi:hypothetical protein